MVMVEEAEFALMVLAAAPEWGITMEILTQLQTRELHKGMDMEARVEMARVAVETKLVAQVLLAS
jgi:hypothetical protein